MGRSLRACTLRPDQPCASQRLPQIRPGPGLCIGTDFEIWQLQYYLWCKYSNNSRVAMPKLPLEHKKCQRLCMLASGTRHVCSSDPGQSAAPSPAGRGRKLGQPKWCWDKSQSLDPWLQWLDMGNPSKAFQKWNKLSSTCILHIHTYIHTFIHTYHNNISWWHTFHKSNMPTVK